MIKQDYDTFQLRLVMLAKSRGRDLSPAEILAYWEDLRELPLDHVLRGVDKGAHDEWMPHAARIRHLGLPDAQNERTRSPTSGQSATEDGGGGTRIVPS